MTKDRDLNAITVLLFFGLISFAVALGAYFGIAVFFTAVGILFFALAAVGICVTRWRGE